ncbi:MAG: DUF134 domain-containing protein [Paludibacter sp.]|jgi:predicted DNA-binding protein (UPF0251 family)|nr:DUF134 domain-containing protein [Paludibacter sp.]
MPRPTQNRKVATPPLMIGYKPFGIPRNQLESIVVHYDEFEVVRLLDYEGLMQEQAAKMMQVSRPTLTRIYESARRKIARAFVEGKMITIEGGNVEFSGEWFRCKRCYKLIDGMPNHRKCEKCAHYGTDELLPLNKVKE